MSEIIGSHRPRASWSYWELRKKMNANKTEFQYYNFQGKLVLKTTAEKDGWDYIVGQEALTYFFRVF